LRPRSQLETVAGLLSIATHSEDALGGKGAKQGKG
jgi:hypothetical protein